MKGSISDFPPLVVEVSIAILVLAGIVPGIMDVGGKSFSSSSGSSDFFDLVNKLDRVCNQENALSSDDTVYLDLEAEQKVRIENDVSGEEGPMLFFENDEEVIDSGVAEECETINRDEINTYGTYQIDANEDGEVDITK